MKIEFTAIGNPKAQKRHRHFHKNGISGNYDPSKDDKGDFLIQALNHRPREPLTGELMLFINFIMPRPKSHFGTGKNSGKLKDSAPINHTSKPDIDNLVKLVLDSLNKIFWKDDSQIFSLRVTKHYVNEGSPRTEIQINNLE